MTSALQVGNSRQLQSQGNEMIDELEYIERTIKEIYETFDNLKESWTGQKADEYKAILEEARTPLETLCKQSRIKNDAINNVSKILSDYKNK